MNVHFVLFPKTYWWWFSLGCPVVECFSEERLAFCLLWLCDIHGNFFFLFKFLKLRNTRIYLCTSVKSVFIPTATRPHSCWSQTRKHHAGRSCKTAVPCQGHRLWQCITCKQGCMQHLSTVSLLSSSRDRPWASVFWSYWHVVTWLCYCWTLLGMATLSWVIRVWSGVF